MNFSYSEKTIELQQKLTAFIEEFIDPKEKIFDEQLNAQENRWAQNPPIMEELKVKAREKRLWNLFLPDSELGAGLINVEYAPLCEIMGRLFNPLKVEFFLPKHEA